MTRRSRARARSWFVYVARCADDTLYCGITNDLAARLAAHNAGKGARYTRSRRPIAIVASRRYASKGRALQLEHRVKQLSREQKQRLIATPAMFASLARKTPARRPLRRVHLASAQQRKPVE
jgi:putative endonuclease